MLHFVKSFFKLLVLINIMINGLSDSDSLTTQLGAANHLHGQARATNIANEAIEALNKAAWLEDGALSEPRLLFILEFTYYIQYLTPNEHRIERSRDVKPGDCLFDFASVICKKLREAPKASPNIVERHRRLLFALSAQFLLPAVIAQRKAMLHFVNIFYSFGPYPTS